MALSTSPIGSYAAAPYQFAEVFRHAGDRRATGRAGGGIAGFVDGVGDVSGAVLELRPVLFLQPQGITHGRQRQGGDTSLTTSNL